MVLQDFREDSGLFRDLRAQLREHMALGAQQHFLLAVSGGADSLLLFYFFIWLSRRDGVKLSVAHFCHQLRPGEDERESAALLELAKFWAVPYYEDSADVRSLARERKAGLEEAARYARHSFLENLRARLARQQESCEHYIALGHNLDDLCETMLLNLGRGTGPRGLASMPYFDGRLVRPLLLLRSSEIRRFLEQRDLPFFADFSNLSGDFLRNRLRHDLIPLWEDILGYAPHYQCYRLADISRQESEVLDIYAREALQDVLVGQDKLNLKRLNKWPRGLHYRVYNAWLQKHTAEAFTLSYALFKDLRRAQQTLPRTASFDLSGSWQLKIKGWLAEIAPVS